jgi:hypothetical protein
MAQIPWNKGKKGLQVAWNKGIPQSKETKERMSKSLKGLPAWNKGKTWSKEVREKISKATKGRTPWNKGIPRTFEEKRKMSMCQKEYLKNHPHQFLGHTHSDKTKRMISMSNKGRPSANKGVAGKNSKSWRGGEMIRNGYVCIYMPSHPFCYTGIYVYEHRLVMEKHLGRYLLPQEEIHHINGIRYDNRIENLMLFSNKSEHMKFHSKH